MYLTRNILGFIYELKNLGKVFVLYWSTYLWSFPGSRSTEVIRSSTDHSQTHTYYWQGKVMLHLELKFKRMHLSFQWCSILSFDISSINSASTSEPPTANIKPTPVAATPSKPSPIAGSKSTPRASIRPMVTPAPVTTPTATVMPTTQVETQEGMAWGQASWNLILFFLLMHNL